MFLFRAGEHILIACLWSWYMLVDPAPIKLYAITLFNQIQALMHDMYVLSLLSCDEDSLCDYHYKKIVANGDLILDIIEGNFAC